MCVAKLLYIDFERMAQKALEKRLHRIMKIIAPEQQDKKRSRAYGRRLSGKHADMTPEKERKILEYYRKKSMVYNKLDRVLKTSGKS